MKLQTTRSCILVVAIAAALIHVSNRDLAAKEPAAHAPAAHTADPTSLSAEQALAKLKAGNEHFVNAKLEHPDQSAERRTELATGQHPFAIILGCADSRTAPEVVFDQGLGDLFVLRVAGNVLNDETIGSIEYAVEHLGSPLIVVLGHERCGAVKAAKETIAAKDEAPGHIQSLVRAISPAVAATIKADAEATCIANVQNVVQALRESDPILDEKVKEGKVKVVGAKYDLDTGVVEFLSDKPATTASNTH